MTSVDGSNRLSIFPSTRVLPRKMRSLRLLHHLLNPRRHRVEFVTQTFQCQLLQDVRRSLDSFGDFLGEPFCLSHHPAGRIEQFAVSQLELLLALRSFGARRPRDVEHPQFHGAAAVPQFGTGLTCDRGDLLHRADQHPHPVAQQAADRSDSGYWSPPPWCPRAFAAFGHPIILGYFHHPFVNLLDRRRPDRQAPAAHGLGVRHLRAAHARKIAVHQIGAHLALQHPIAPIAHVLEDQKTQHHFGRSAQPATGAALGMPLRQRFINCRYDLFIV